MDVRLRLTGVKEIDAVLKGLPLQLNHKVLQSAHAAAAKPLVNAEKLLAPEGPTGNLVDSIGVVKVPISRADSIGQIQVGPRRRYKGNAAHLVEYGTVTRKNKRGANRGKMTAKPFAGPAWQQTQGVVQGGIRNQIGIQLSAYMRRMIKRHG
jgi:hypothetical protein